jgi:putative FmdB family regulatory protein
MPTYEYMCKKCGPFTQMRAMAECELPSACPECRARAPRVLLTAPSCLTTSPEARPGKIARSRMQLLRRPGFQDGETCQGESVSAGLTDLASRIGLPHSSRYFEVGGIFGPSVN